MFSFSTSLALNLWLYKIFGLFMSHLGEGNHLVKRTRLVSWASADSNNSNFSLIYFGESREGTVWFSVLSRTESILLSLYGTSIKTKYNWKKQRSFIYLKCDNFDQNVPTLLPHQQEIYSLQTRIIFSNMFLKSFTHSLYYKKYICLLDFLFKTCALNNSPSPRLLKFVFVGCVGCAGQIVAWIAYDRVGL